jgi:hypothetical protein
MYKKENNWRLSSFASLITGIVVLLMSGFVYAQAYEGDEFCKGCHEANYNDWKASGHPYKLMKGEDAKNRPIPLPNGYNWPEDGVLVPGDVSYVIGGYKWKSRYMDDQGYIITNTCEPIEPFDSGCTPVAGVNQYNYMTGEWVDYHADEPNGTKPYDCGSCHTTHWVADEDALTDNDLTDNQDGLPGIWGTFDAGGVHCEQCHGNGGGDGHMSGTDRIDKSAEACGVCHFRTAAPGAEVNVIPASGGFIKHHEQYNEFLASPHSNMECVTCHDPHKRGEFSIKEQGECTFCHTTQTASYALNSMSDYGVECKDCHMPFATKSGNQLGPFEGDLQTHLFYINTDGTANMFTDDGTAVDLNFAVPGKPERVNKGATTVDFACMRCHETGDRVELGTFAKNFHGTDTSKNELEYIGLNPGLTGNWWGGADRNGEGFLLEVAKSGGALTLIGSFYTYDTEGNQIWLIAVGVADGSMTTNVTFYINDGQKWGDAFDPNDVNQVEFGTGTFTFPACDVGSVSITPNATYMALGYTALSYDLNRSIVDYQVACPSMFND